MTVWINGRLEADSAARVSVFDHGLITGDGVFESVKVRDGVPFALSRHLDRLAVSAAGLGLGTLDLGWIRQGVLAVIEASAPGPLARARITVTGGVGPLGSQRIDSVPTVIVALGPLSPQAATVDVAVAPWPRNERGALAGLKTISYAENVRALAWAATRGAGEAVFANTAGELCEGTGTNVFIVNGGRLVTPPLSSGCLAGVTRGLVIEWAGAVEQTIPVNALAGADEAFLTGTTRDVQPIHSVDGTELPAVPGPSTRKVAEIFATRASESADP